VGDAAFAEFGQHGGVVDTQVLADRASDQSRLTEVDGGADLVEGE
jgi:hypothetical protein